MARTTKQVAKQGDIAAEMAQLKAQVSSATENNRRLTSMVTQLLTAPVGGRNQDPAPVEEKAPEIDMAGLPNPVEDAEGYAKALNARVSKFSADVLAFNTRQANAAAARQRPAQDQSEAFNAIQLKFNTKYPELAKADAYARICSADFFREAAAKGLDPIRYALADDEGFIDDVASRMRTKMESDGVVLKTPVQKKEGLDATQTQGRLPAEARPPIGLDVRGDGAGDGEGDDPGSLEGDPADRSDGSEPPNRTQVLADTLGISDTAAQGQARRAKPSNLTDEIKEMQANMWPGQARRRG